MSSRPPILTASDTAALAEGCYFDRAKAHKAIRWIVKTLGFHPYRWQRRLLAQYFGWRRGDGSYRFTRITCFISKKNGKTTLIAALVGYKLFELKNARIYSAAFNALQARILLEQLIDIFDTSPVLKKQMKRGGKIRAFCSPFRRDITCDITRSRYMALADNFNSSDGLIPDVVILDEIHRMKNVMVDVVMGGLENNPTALAVIISTAGSGDKGHRSWQEYSYAKEILTGQRIDTRMLPVIYEHPNPAALKGTEIYTMSALLAANPVLNEVPAKRAEAEKELEKAKSLRNDRWWRRHKLGEWCASDGEVFIGQDEYATCEGPTPDLSGAKTYVGIDKSSGQWDFSAVSLLHLLTDGTVYEQHHAFAVADRLPTMAEKDDTDYTPYVDTGELQLIPADAVADEWLAEWILTKLQGLNIQTIGADPYAASYILERLAAKSFKVLHVQQSNNKLLTPVIQDYADRIRQHRIIHSHNALYEWQLAHARRYTTSKDSLKIVKTGSNTRGQGGIGHIDNVDALLNALAVLRADELIHVKQAAGCGGIVTV